MSSRWLPIKMEMPKLARPSPIVTVSHLQTVHTRSQSSCRTASAACTAVAIWIQETYGFADVPPPGNALDTQSYLALLNDVGSLHFNNTAEIIGLQHAPFSFTGDAPTSTPNITGPTPTQPSVPLTCDFTSYVTLMIAYTSARSSNTS